MKKEKSKVKVKSGPRMDGTRSLSQRRTITLYPEDLELARKLMLKHNIANLAELVRYFLHSN